METAKGRLVFPFVREEESDAGISLREYYAAHAPELPYPLLKPLLEQVKDSAGENGIKAEEILAHCLAKWAFRYADAMIRVAQKD